MIKDKYLKYCLLILLYELSIIIYASPSSISFNVFLNMPTKELFNEIIRMIMLSIAIDIIAVVLAIGTIICIVELIFNKFGDHKLDENIDNLYLDFNSNL